MLRRISDVLGIRHKELVNDGAFDGKLRQIRDSDHFLDKSSIRMLQKS